MSKLSLKQSPVIAWNKMPTEGTDMEEYLCWVCKGQQCVCVCAFVCVCVCVCVRAHAHAQLFLTLSISMDCILPGSSVHGIFQA